MMFNPDARMARFGPEAARLTSLHRCKRHGEFVMECVNEARQNLYPVPWEQIAAHLREHHGYTGTTAEVRAWVRTGAVYGR